jgi:hypothetical protein
MRVFFVGIREALVRARWPIAWMGIAYLVGVALGAGMAHAHNGFALAKRDSVVGQALAIDPASVALSHGFPVRAALTDFAENLGKGAVPSTVMGLGVVLPFPAAVYRGWIGGIVSVDNDHRSRMSSWREGVYYVGVVLLQLIPYSLAGGAGVRLGLANLLPNSRWGYPGSKRWLTLPVDGLFDVGRIYLLIVPLFLIASLVEFLAG